MKKKFNITVFSVSLWMLLQIMYELIERIPHLAIATLYSERYYRVRRIASLMREYFIVGKVILSTTADDFN